MNVCSSDESHIRSDVPIDLSCTVSHSAKLLEEKEKLAKQKEKFPEQNEKVPVQKENLPEKKENIPEQKENIPEPKERTPKKKEPEEINTDLCYTCIYCNAVYVVELNIIQHLNAMHCTVYFENLRKGIQSFTKSYDCIKCKLKFTSSKELIHHLLSLHSVAKCNVCSKLFSSVNSCYTHLVIHSKTEMFECALCTERYLNRFGLKRHFASAHKMQGAPPIDKYRLIYRCKQCMTIFSLDDRYDACKTCEILNRIRMQEAQ